ncbi:MAG: fasciclin domain-containing protein [Mycobacterium sp.]
MTVHGTAGRLTALLAVAAVLVAGCSAAATVTGPSPTGTPAAAPASGTTTAESAESSEVPAPPPAVGDAVGAGCAGYATVVPMGPGSLGGMAADPAVAAISNSPLLTTLSSALTGKLNSEVNLAETLNTGPYTVFAPTDTAWGRLDPDLLVKIRNDPELAASILKYHVVAEQVEPSQFDGERTTLQGAPLKLSASGEDLKVNEVPVACGGIRTANAVLYLIDTVLMPPPPVSVAPSTSPTTTTTTTPGQ